ncbi:MAG TPA: hypothetical protein VFB06_29455 [Streptosporangiaceae bacterium]|nr:hypothetical protein [Streptosporangiaceae bacterium]
MDHVLIVLVLVTAYGLFVLVFPDRPCRCAGRCRRCKGTGRRFRLGARLVHRGVVKGYREARRRWAQAPATRERRH